MSYNQRREQGDRYIAHSNQIAMGLLISQNLIDVDFRMPSNKQDREEGIDQIIKVSPVSMAYRTRSYENKGFFLEGFTLRTSSFQGCGSELDKVRHGLYADYLLYGLADEEDSGLLHSAFLLDIKAIGAQIAAYPWLIDQATKGHSFVEFPYDDEFWPQPVIAGTWNLQKSRRNPVGVLRTNPPVISKTEEEKTNV